MELSAELYVTAMSHGLVLRVPKPLASRIECESVFPSNNPPKEWPISIQRCTFLLGSRAAKASSSRVARQLTWEAIPAATDLQPGQRPIASRAALSVQLGPNQRRYNARVG